MKTTLKAIKAHMQELSDPERAGHSRRYFKTGIGDYGEGDLFFGIRVPVLRKLVRQYRGLPIPLYLKLLQSKYHEERLLALLLLVDGFAKGNEQDKETIYSSYLGNTQYINNWDLVDSSAHHIVGAYLKNRDRQPLYDLVISESLWERRIAIISTFHFIQYDQFEDTLKLVEMLLTDQEDLIHKATGWALRVVGNRNREVEEAFLVKHYRRMPRTMLRYAIERFEEGNRQKYLKGKV